MKSVRRENTAPEISVRSYLHGAGLRFRVNVRSLPGTPDVVLARWAAVVFVHGCFWHGHSCKHGRIQAKTNAAFWSDKIARNRETDRAKARALRVLGWHVERIWECQCESPRALAALVRRIVRSR
jgi:DNA mismatch endonuclease (patch repair protein)